MRRSGWWFRCHHSDRGLLLRPCLVRYCLRKSCLLRSDLLENCLLRDCLLGCSLLRNNDPVLRHSRTNCGLGRICLGLILITELGSAMFIYVRVIFVRKLSILERIPWSIIFADGSWNLPFQRVIMVRVVEDQLITFIPCVSRTLFLWAVLLEWIVDLRRRLYGRHRDWLRVLGWLNWNIGDHFFVGMGSGSVCAGSRTKTQTPRSSSFVLEFWMYCGRRDRFAL